MRYEYGPNDLYLSVMNPTPRIALFVRWWQNLTILSMGGAAEAAAGGQRGLHGLSAQRARRTKSRRPEGLQTRSWGPEGP